MDCINRNIEIYNKINEIYLLIQDYYMFGTLIDVETGEIFKLSIGIKRINELLEQTNDEEYIKYEENRKEECLQMFERKLGWR